MSLVNVIGSGWSMKGAFCEINTSILWVHMPSQASLIVHYAGTSVEVTWKWGDGLNDTLVHNTLETWRPGSGIPEIRRHTYAIPAERLEVKVTVKNNYEEYNFTVAILDIYKAIVEDELQLICPFAPYVDGEGREKSSLYFFLINTLLLELNLTEIWTTMQIRTTGNPGWFIFDIISNYRRFIVLLSATNYITSNIW